MPRVQWCISIVIYNKTSLYLPTLHTLLSSHYTANTLQGAQRWGGIVGGGGVHKVGFYWMARIRGSKWRATKNYNSLENSWLLPSCVRPKSKLTSTVRQSTLIGLLLAPHCLLLASNWPEIYLSSLKSWTSSAVKHFLLMKENNGILEYCFWTYKKHLIIMFFRINSLQSTQKEHI